MRSRLFPLLAAVTILLGACGGDDPADDTVRSSRSNGGKGGRAGASGATNAGAAGASRGGAGGIAGGQGFSGNTAAGAAGSAVAGSGGNAGFGGTMTLAGAGGTTTAGSAGSTSAGFGGSAAGSPTGGAAGSPTGGAGGSTTGGTAGSSAGVGGSAGTTAGGAAGAGGGGAGSGPADCTGTLPAGDRQLQGSVFMTNQTRPIDMTQFINIGESSAPGAALNGYPGRTGNTWVPFIQRDKFVAFAFQADLARGESQSFNIAETTVVTPAFFSVSISECPGDFRPSLPPNCRVSGGFGTIISARHPTENYPGVCMLRPGRTYYFNITHRDAANATTCPEAVSECGNLFGTTTP